MELENPKELIEKAIKNENKIPYITMKEIKEKK